MTTPTPVACIECGKPSIALCPYCQKPVHHGYGADTHSCSAKHEQQCSGARWAREAAQPK